MNPWDLVTWFSAIALAVSAVVIFVFFLRDARSILNRETRADDELENATPSDSTPGRADPPAAPENLPR